jgi:hypothetical protein
MDRGTKQQPTNSRCSARMSGLSQKGGLGGEGFSGTVGCFLGRRIDLVQQARHTRLSKYLEQGDRQEFIPCGRRLP